MKNYFLTLLFLTSTAFAYETVTFKGETRGDIENADLVIKYEMLDGVQEDNRNTRYLKSTYTRGDLGSVEIWCSSSLSGFVRKNSSSAEVSCNLSTLGEDGESLAAHVREDRTLDPESREATVNVRGDFDYGGDGTELSEENKVLMGEGQEGLFHSKNFETNKVKKSSSNMNKNPYELAAWVNDQLKKHFGRSVSYTDGDVQISGKITRFDWSLDSNSDLFLTAYIGEAEDYQLQVKGDMISLLKTAGDLSSGYDAAKFSSRIQDGFPWSTR